MKHSKFGVFDIILAVVIVLGIGLNVFVYGFYDSGGLGESADSSGGRPASSQSPAGESPAGGGPADGGSGSGPDGGGQPQAGSSSGQSADDPPRPATEQPGNTPSPQEPVVNTMEFRLNSLNVTVNGQVAAIDDLGSAPFNLDGVSMLPLRATYAILGGSIEFDSATGYISATFLDSLLKVKIGETGAEINGTPVTLNVAPTNRDGAGYVPARAVADALGAELLWNGEMQTLTLTIPSESLINASALLPPASESPASSAPPLPDLTDYTPSGPPTVEDFAWYMGGARPEGLPQGAERVADLIYIFGDWKMLIWADPDHIVDNMSYHTLAAANINEVGGTVLMDVLELVMFDENGTAVDVSGSGSVSYSGEYLPDDRGIYAGDSWFRFVITDFYVRDGRQFGVGRLEVSSGKPCYIALVRP